MAQIKSRNAAVFSGFLSLGVWVFLSLWWWAHLEGDSPIYPLMSVEVLGGRQYLMTPGQAHGGTLLVYIRALFFYIFGVSHFLGFFINGLTVALSAYLWTRFAVKALGEKTGWIAAVLFAVCTERFARAACTDYFAITLVTGGIMINSVLYFVQKQRVTKSQAMYLGLLAGFSWYLCRFSALYALASIIYFLGLISPQQRAIFIPTKKEVLGNKSSKIALFSLIGLAVLTLIAFLTSDRFLGIDAESNLKTTVMVAAVFWFAHRRNLVFKSIPKLLIFVAGVLIGFIPEIIFRLLTQHKDRVTGLVRFSDIMARASELPSLIGVNFHFYKPSTYGLISLSALLLILILGSFKKKPHEEKMGFEFAILPVLVIAGAWFGVHTYMHLSPQYFFPLFFPLYLAVAQSISRTRFQAPAIMALFLVLGITFSDHWMTMKTKNLYVESGLLEKLESWKKKYQIKAGWGDYPSHLDITWASKAQFVLPDWFEDTRFPHYADAIQKEKYVYVARNKIDIHGQPPMPESQFQLIEKAEFSYGFEALLYLRKSQ